MFIVHYDKKFIDCTNTQFDTLVYITKTLYKIYGSEILEHEILEAMYKDDNIFYASKFLFSSKRSLDSLHPNYCNLAKLLYIYYCGNKYPMELDSIVNSMCIKDIPLDLIYSEYY